MAYLDRSSRCRACLVFTILSLALVLSFLHFHSIEMHLPSILTTTTAATGLVVSQSTGQNDSSTFTNPILSRYGADPWVVRHDHYYYMTYTTGDNITILRSQSLTHWDAADVKLAFEPPQDEPYTYSNWAPELHYFESYQKWYIIYTADIDPDMPDPQVDMLCDFTCPAVNHRMFVLEGSCDDPWESEYEFKAELDTFDQFAIDGTYFRHDGRLFHIYSCWYDRYTSWPANLCITEMSNPWTVSSPLSQRAIISTPDQPWEKTPYNRTINVRLSTNEAPQQLTNPTTSQQFIIYSGGRSDNVNYCLGLLELTGPDPLSADSWTKHTADCVFKASAEAGVYGVGHASFVQSPDGTQWWIVYHGMGEQEVEMGVGWKARTIRTQMFGWDEGTGLPVFGVPQVGPLEVPSGG